MELYDYGNIDRDIRGIGDEDALDGRAASYLLLTGFAVFICSPGRRCVASGTARVFFRIFSCRALNRLGFRLVCCSLARAHQNAQCG